MIYEIFRGKNKQFYFRLKARNGRIIAQSEGYKRKAGVINALTALGKMIKKGGVKVKDLTIK
jgi:uncharacterized protein YegP (UPF0339 family)